MMLSQHRGITSVSPIFSAVFAETFFHPIDIPIVALLTHMCRTTESAMERLSRMSDAPSGALHTRSLSTQKRPISPPCGDPSYTLKKMRSFRAQNPQQQQQLNELASFILSICAICLGRHKHDVIRCAATRTWDNKNNVFSERVGSAIHSKAGKLLCSKWQRAGGCSDTHQPLHTCSGCGSKSHGAQRCPRAENPISADAIQS